MEKSYLIEISEGITVIRFIRKPEFNEILEAINEASTIDEYNLRLWDMRAGLDLSNEEIDKIARHGKAVWRTPSKAAVVAPNDLAFGLIRMFEVHREQEEHLTRAFRTEKEAIKWLKEQPEYNLNYNSTKKV